MLNNRWRLKEPADDYTVKSLADSLNISEVLATLLIQRNVTNFSQAKSFFRPTLDSLYDPFLMHGMEDATLRVIKALTENEQITIYGDYDVDGTCSTALLYLFLKELGANVDFYIPERLTEGYGLSSAGIKYIHEKGTSLLITVDCGITAVEETAFANSLGLDVIICDHHQPKDSLPPALAVLDPLKPECKYPFKYLSGAGLAFKLAQGVSDRIGKRGLPYQYLDLVALAGAADIVPLVDENRILVKEGINQINLNPRPGISALMKSSNMEPGNLSSGQIIFTLAPRINAVGRMGDAERAVALLITKDHKEASELANILESENCSRRKIDEDTFISAMDIITNTLNLEEQIPIVLHQDTWHPGVIGIVASRLVEKFYRPTIMLTTVDGVAKGSARSISNFNIYEALKKCEDVLLQFGGHKAAAGLAVEVDKVDEFRSKFYRIVKESLSIKDLLPEVSIDTKIKFSEVTPKFLRILDQFSPFGPENHRPVFISEDVMIAGFPRIVGVNHLLLSLKQKCSDKIFDCIGFNLAHFHEPIAANNSTIDVVYSIDKSVRDGRVFPQFRIKDIKVKPKY
jgi:single-stranded-DNA-specific exonuclease